jgi:hypothetical protein
MEIPEKVNNEAKGKSTFDFKEREHVNHLTEFQDKYRGRFDPNAIGQLNEKLLKDLRSVHFDYRDDEHFRGQSEYKDHYIKQGNMGVDRTFDDNKLRKGNFKLGDLPGEYRTIYRDKFKYPANNY